VPLADTGLVNPDGTIVDRKGDLGKISGMKLDLAPPGAPDEWRLSGAGGSARGSFGVSNGKVVPTNVSADPSLSSKGFSEPLGKRQEDAINIATNGMQTFANEAYNKPVEGGGNVVSKVKIQPGVVEVTAEKPKTP
jgi:hypothetical protein